MNKREWMLTTASAALANGLGPLGELEVTTLSLTYDAIVAITPDSDDGGWLEWRGEKPYPEGIVDYVTANGYSGTRDSDDLIWTHDGDMLGSEIIKWRPARD